MPDATVLIVDDEPGLLQLFGTLIRRLGFQVMTADGGAEALDILAEMVPDLLILDLGMPQVSGFDVLAAVQADPELDPMRVIILTAQGPGRLPEELIPRIDEWISKPVLPNEFLETVQRVLYA